MFGYNWATFHAAVNDLPTALLVVGFLFDIAWWITKRESLRWAGFWTIIAGTLGAGIAVIAGEQAADHIAHSEAVHEIMETHEHLALITLGIFIVVALWRIVRERKMGTGERGAMTALALAGVIFVGLTGHEGGEMVFEHAAGVPTPALQQELQGRAEAHHHHDGDEDSDSGAEQQPPDSGHQH